MSRFVSVFSGLSLLSGAAASAPPPTSLGDECDTKSYTCANGYYGTPTDSSTGCTLCPEHATCAGTGNTTFICISGYYKIGATCAPCPDGGTSIAGARAITDCYLPTGTSFEDAYGTFELTDKCYYSN
ncbi:MAG: hypothetical protein LBJ73_00260 [Rickettsiales bacterium]|nr:hypothetical protein [Rickettsiales bacterium]